MAVAYDQPSLIFVHIPKTAGTTLNRIIDWEYNPLRVYSLNGRYFRWAYHRLTRLSARQLAKFRIFKGHMPYGLHRYLPQPARYLTILRDPIDRAISEYFFAVTDQFHPDRQHVSQMTLEEFVRSDPSNNTQTKRLSGQIKGYDFLAGDCTPAMLDSALENLDRDFELIGLSERFEESLALAKITFGWKIPRYGSFRVTKRRPPKSEIPESTRTLIADLNQFDIALYRRGVALFEQKIEQYRDQLEPAITAVREAKEYGTQSYYYRGASTVLKALSIFHSTIRF
jgi:hypothetical protein